MQIQIHKILCPIDFSLSCHYALKYAVAMAERYNATLELLHVAEPSAYTDDVPLEGDEPGPTYEERVRQRLLKLVESAGGKVAIDSHLVTGVPYVEIIKRAGTLPADLIVLGTHGRTGLKHLLIGSVAERVVRMASCPVCTVRHPEHAVGSVHA